MSELDRKQVQHVLELDFRAGFVQLRKRCVATHHAGGEQTPKYGHRGACAFCTCETKQPARVASKEFGIGEG
jgi:hypothetical protein